VTLADLPVRHPVRERRLAFNSGRVIRVRTDVVDLPGGDRVTRDVVEHPGAVGVIALDDAERVLLVQQYRHAAGHLLWEPPAGLLDVSGEDPLAAASRELAEEAGQAAVRWDVLVDAFTTPGMSNEAVRIYLARDLTVVERPPGEGEERDMPIRWVPLDEAVRAVFAGALHNPMAAIGLLAAQIARRDGFALLRPAGADWPAWAAAKA